MYTGGSVQRKNQMLHKIDGFQGVHGTRAIMPKTEINALGWHKSLVPTTGDPIPGKERAKGMPTWKVVLIVLAGIIAFYWLQKKKII